MRLVGAALLLYVVASGGDDLLSSRRFPSHVTSSAMASLDADSMANWDKKKDTVLGWESSVNTLSDDDVGITEYIKPKQCGTGGILKMGWSDFRVQEIRDRDLMPVVLTHVKHPGPRPPGCNFLRFVLAKAGYDTVSAVGKISQQMRVQRDRFRHAGIKDKSAVTCQEVSWDLRGVKGDVDVGRLLSVSDWMPRIKIGNVEYCQSHLQAGIHGGNRFTVLMRRLELTKDRHIRRAVKYLPRRGFINYYGHQRFGLGMRSGMPTVKVGKALLQTKWDDAIAHVMDWECGVADSKERDVKRCFSNEWKRVRRMGTGRSNETKRIALDAADGMPAHCFGEKAMLQGLARGQSVQQALREMPHRVLYMLAYWSWLWNHAASERIRRYGGKKVVVGDLVCPEEAERGVGDKQLNVYTVTTDDVESGRYSIFDVVLPLGGKGARMVFPENKVGEAMRRMMEEEGILGSVVDIKGQDQGSAAPLLYRHLVVRPQNFSWEVLRYAAESDLVVSDYSDGGRFTSVWSCSGDGGGIARQGSEAEDGRKGGKKEKQKEKSKHEGFVALQMQFALPPAAFATSLIREVSKQSVHPNRHVEMRKNVLSKP